MFDMLPTQGFIALMMFDSLFPPGALRLLLDDSPEPRQAGRTAACPALGRRVLSVDPTGGIHQRHEGWTRHGFVRVGLQKRSNTMPIKSDLYIHS